MIFKSLSKREKEVLDLIAQGFSNKEVASQLSISLSTVENYMTIILTKLNARNRTQAAVIYSKSKKN